ncbi:hypothetical protein [Limnohabitans sp.]|uniref:hypothetical protein n=1 Tax=Limnohabitans sp. TaxID=1907725 RepID=UPI00286F4C04|nr:hypothetical protein [Limnohabitans sp.]
MLTKNFIFLLSVTVALSGCVAAAFVPSAGILGANAGGVGTADEQKLTEITAKNFGVDKTQISVSNLQKDSSALGGSSIYYDVEITTKGQKKNLKCMVSSSFGVTSLPLCAKPGESLTGGGSDSCNALLKAAGKC